MSAGTAPHHGRVAAPLCKSGALTAALILVACAGFSEEPAETRAAEGAPRSATASGPDASHLIERFECARCHDGPGFPTLARDQRCVGCHRDILRGTFDADAQTLARWQQRIVSLRQAPSLVAAARRLRRDWVAAYLVAPEKVRPRLPASMPRLPMTDVEAETLAAHLVPDASGGEPLPASPADVVRGAALYRTLGCGSCHAFTGLTGLTGNGPSHVPAGIRDQVTTDAVGAAPDLALARQRLRPDATVAWLRSPTSMDPDTQMPDFGLGPDDARALAVFILGIPLSAAVPPAAPKRLPVLDRRVTYDEVSERVFRKTCWHCHSNADLARGDGGPGNSGGLGYPARGLDLSSYRGIAAGSRGEDGRRRSVFLPGPSGEPVLVERLLQRRRETRGDAWAGAAPGMPLGLPAVSAEDLQLVESWIAQGRPR